MESDKEKWHEITEEQYNYLIHEYQSEGLKTKYTGIKDIFGKASCFFIGTDQEFNKFLEEYKAVKY